MTPCFCVSDLHGNTERYKKLFDLILSEKPKIVFFGGDILPSGISHFSSNKEAQLNFIHNFLFKELKVLKKELKDDYPSIYLILGNDDAKIEEPIFIDASKKGLFHYCHKQKHSYNEFCIYGYSYVPPTPFQLKDWEKYDVSRYTDIGGISPEEGLRTVEIDKLKLRFSTIKKDLEELANNSNPSNSIFLFHSPPYETNLDRAALDNTKVDHVQLDVHVGSIAIKKFIESKQPYVTLHGHIHESAKLLDWKDKIGETFCFNAAHDGNELSIIHFDLESPQDAIRKLY